MSMHFPFLFFYRFCINDLYVYGISLGEEEVVKDAVQNLFLKIYFEEIRFRFGVGIDADECLCSMETCR